MLKYVVTNIIPFGWMMNHDERSGKANLAHLMFDLLGLSLVVSLLIAKAMGMSPVLF